MIYIFISYSEKYSVEYWLDNLNTYTHKFNFERAFDFYILMIF